MKLVRPNITPGPWYLWASLPNADRGKTDVCRVGDCIVIRSSKERIGPSQVDAKVIAALPSLLDALEQAAECIGTVGAGYPLRTRSMEKINAALILAGYTESEERATRPGG